MAKELSRDEELSDRKKVRDQLAEISKHVDQGYVLQRGRSDAILDLWDIYHCTLGSHQYYNGNSKIFVPLVHDAVEARKTRFTNQVFPQSGRYVEVIVENGDIPNRPTALLEHYVRKDDLRARVVPPLCRNGDVEGQYTLYASWLKRSRHTVWKEKRQVELEPGIEIPDVEIDDIEEEVIFDDRPTVEVIPDSDLLVLPSTADSIDDAIEQGGSVTVMRRWSKAKVDQLEREGEITGEAADLIRASMKRESKFAKQDIKKSHVDAAGIKEKGKFYLAFETWCKIKIGKGRRLVRAYLGGDGVVLGCKLNPYWCDRCPVFSRPVDKETGSFKGISKIKPIAEMQYLANDAVNEGADSMAFSMLPITTYDPTKVPNPGTFVLDLAALWAVEPNSVKFMSFPALWKDGLEAVNACKAQIQQSLGVNPSMIPQQTGSRGGKRNQAEIANEQQVDILTTADSVSTLEALLSDVLAFWAELDAQYRDEDLSVRAFGQFGERLKIDAIPPIQMGRRWEFRWFGVEQARNMAQLQQQVAGMNVLRGIPPNLLGGRKINLVPLIEQMVSNMFGPRLAPLIFPDEKALLSLDPAIENKMLLDGFDVDVGPMDDDPAHIAAHQTAMAGADEMGKPALKVHILHHLASMAMKAQGAQQQMDSAQGSPGGSGPGVAGQPRIGAAPAGPRPGQGPPGMQHMDRIGPQSGQPPRRAG